MAEKPKDFHKLGEKDAAGYKGFNKPRDTSGPLTKSVKERWEKENKQYGAGWTNARKQR